MNRLFAALSAAIFALISIPAFAQTTPINGNVVSACGTPNGSAYTTGQARPVTLDTNGNVCTTSSGGGGTTGNVNITQIGGNAVATGTGASNTGTIRTVTSTDSTIGVEGQDGATQTSLTNPFPVTPGTGSTFKVNIDQTTPGTSNAVSAAQGTAAPVTGGWPTIAGEPTDTTGTFTNGTQTGNVTTPLIDGYETATITIHGTYGTASATFLGSDDGGTTYYPLQCARSDGSAVETGYTSLTNVSRAWYCPIHSFDTVQVLSSAVASGTVSVRISISSFPTAAGVAESVSSSTLATAANQPTNVTAGSTSSGQTGTIVFCQTTNVAQGVTYTNAQSNQCVQGIKGQILVTNAGQAVTSLATSGGGFCLTGPDGGCRANAMAPFLYDGTNTNIGLGCTNSAAVSVTSGTTVQIVALTAGKQIRVCSFGLSISLAGTAQFEYGTGTTCGTGTTILTGAMNMTAGVPFTMNMAEGQLFASASGNALCIVAATGNVNGFISYAVF